MPDFIETLRGIDFRLFSVGKNEITIGDVLMVLVSISVLFVVAGWARTWVAERALGRSRLDHSTRHAIGTITRYVVLVAGFMVIMQTVGINLEAAQQNPHVRKEPAPLVRLNMPTAAAFPFDLQLWSERHDRDELLNELHCALHEKLSGANVKLV